MTFTVQNLADRYGTTQHTVLGWIDRGELKAINVARKPGGRPRWRITQESLEEFEQRRSSDPAPRRSRQKATAAAGDVIDRY